MAYIGRGPTNSGEFIILDDISSGFDGSDTSFTLTVGTAEVTPAAANVTIALDGVIQTATSAYSVTGSTINFTEAPESGQEFHGVLAGQSQYISDSSITNQHISGTANISGSKINTDFGSQNIQIIHVTASGDISVDSMSIPVLSTMSSSIATRFDSRETDMTLATASIAAITASLGQPVNTDSNVTFGTITSGDINSSGTITATEIHTTFVSSSIAVASGSNIFGDDTADSHQFTGSLNVSGAINLNDGNLIVTDKVGIGTTSPTTKLHLSDGASTAVIAKFTNDTTGNTINDGSSIGIDGDGDLLIYNVENKEIKFYTNDTQRAVIDNGGNVGIGTDNPGYQLDLRRNDTGTTTSLGIRQIGSGDASMAFQTTTSPYGFCIGVDGSDSDAFKFATGTDDVGTNTKLTITTSGRLGIGDTSPGSPLDVKSGEAANTANFNSTNGATNITLESNGSLIGQMEFSGPGPSQIVTRTSASLALGSNNVQTLYITDDDNVGIGTNNPTEKLTINDGDILVGSGRGVRANGGQEMIRFDSSDGVKINSGNAERLRVKTTGQIETTYGDSSYNLYINGLASSATKGILMAVGGSSGTVDQMLFRDGNSHNCGTITSDASANTTAYGTSSDYRLKENQIIIPNALERLNKIKPYRFNFISAPDQTMDGFFAHELAEHIPEAVVGEKDAMEDGEIKPQNIDYGKITPLLVKALQEADDKIEALTARIEALEG